MNHSLSRNRTRIVNARILTKNRSRVVIIEVKDGKIESIKKSKIIPDVKSWGNQVNAGGNLVLPAFIDTHVHLFSLAEQNHLVNLKGSSSIKSMLKRISDFVARTSNETKSHGWLIGRGWDQDRFKERKFPTRFDLDRIVNDKPAIMVRVCGHIAVVNSKALDILLNTSRFKKFGTELIPVDSYGRHVGILKETAHFAAWKLIPRHTRTQLESLFLESQDIVIQNGIAAVHCILDENWKNELAAIDNLDVATKIKIRVSLFLPISALKIIEKLRSAQRRNLLEGKMFKILGFKLFADGSLGARTAALSEEYSDDPQNKGILNYDLGSLIKISKRTKTLGLILASHAIGDRAVDQILRSYELAGITKKDNFRIEHCSLLRPDLMSRLELATLSIQPIFSITDYWINSRLGRGRARFAYPFRSILRHAVAAGGSDAPFDSVSPLFGLFGATHNRVRTESLTIRQALKLYTSTASKMSPLTRGAGEIAKGKECDLIVLGVSELRDVYKRKIRDVIISGKLMTQMR